MISCDQTGRTAFYWAMNKRHMSIAGDLLMASPTVQDFDVKVLSVNCLGGITSVYDCVLCIASFTTLRMGVPGKPNTCRKKDSTGKTRHQMG